MTKTAQKAFDVYRISDCGAVDCFRMKWPHAAIPENLKVTVSQDTCPLRTAARLRALATRIESGNTAAIGREG